MKKYERRRRCSEQQSEWEINTTINHAVVSTEGAVWALSSLSLLCRPTALLVWECEGGGESLREDGFWRLQLPPFPSSSFLPKGFLWGRAVWSARRCRVSTWWPRIWVAPNEAQGIPAELRQMECVGLRGGGWWWVALDFKVEVMDSWEPLRALGPGSDVRK